MAATIDLNVYSDALVVLGTAGVVVPVVQRSGISPVFGYLVAGAVLGPLGLGAIAQQWPALNWLTVKDAANLQGLGDLGVVFLLFLIGLELSYERLLAMRRLVFGLGGLQVAVTTAVLSVLLLVAGRTPVTAVVIGACLALSSTAIVLELLSRQGRMATRTGRVSFAVLLAQDLAVIPLLMVISILGANAGSSIMATFLQALLQAAAAVGLIVLVGRVLLRPLLRVVAETRSTELFIATILFVIVATGVVAALANLSMALGAFVAGLLLAETEYRKAVEATIEPFKGLLLGLFFFTVGMSIDIGRVLGAPLPLFATVAALVAVKALILLGLLRLFSIGRDAAIESALLLGPGGEFAFVGLGLAMTLGVLPAPEVTFALAVTTLSMALLPLLAMLGRHLTTRIASTAKPDPTLLVAPDIQSQHVIVVGHGRVGQVLCTMLARHRVPYTAVDQNAATIARARAEGTPVYFGDATNETFLRACGIMAARGVVVTIHDHERIDEIIGQVRRLRPDIPVVARARDAAHARHLYALGVTDAVPETIEASLQLSEAALVGFGVPTGPVIASIHDLRDEFRRDLQSAAVDAGRADSRSLRASARS